ncbi:MAG TPA: hypothetical protein VGJ26_07730 [Pirellulales bacterium]|jgi:hypothetical protein
MSRRRYTLTQLFHYITWMCVGFAGMSFSTRKWNLPLDVKWDAVANLEPVARVSAFVIGWVIVCAAAICLLTTRRRGGVLIAALLAIFPGALIGAIISSKLGDGDMNLGVFPGAAVSSLLVILGALVPPKNAAPSSEAPIPEGDSSQTAS